MWKKLSKKGRKNKLTHATHFVLKVNPTVTSIGPSFSHQSEREIAAEFHNDQKTSGDVNARRWVSPSYRCNHHQDAVCDNLFVPPAGRYSKIVRSVVIKRAARNSARVVRKL